MNQRKIKQCLMLVSLVLAGLVPFQTSLADTKHTSLFLDETYFDYDIHWSFLKIGSAQLSFHQLDPKNTFEEAYEIRFSVKSNELISAIYPVKTHIVSTLIKIDDEIKPSSYKKNSNEGGKQRDSLVRFDYQLNQIIEEKNQVQLSPIDIEPNLQDPLSLILAICQNDFQSNPTFLQNVTDGGQIVPIESSYVEMQAVNTEIGEFQSQVIDIDPKGLRGVFKKSPDANVILYLNDQSPAIPVKLKSKVRVGSFYAILSGGMYQGKPIQGQEIETLQSPSKSSDKLKKRFKR